MKVLAACEESQTITRAFRDQGHDAYSCDMQPCSGPYPEYHIQTDVQDLLTNHYDLIIACPPCTHLASSGARYFAQKRADGRQQEAIVFFMALVNAPCERIAIENPVGIMSTQYRRPNQIIQPYHFGHDASKKTCLWLKGLPLLEATQYIPPRIIDGKERWGNQTDSGQNRLTPHPERAKNRSKTYTGIAKAMAHQWTK
jgi:site-specific DNA-cytosine methylase